MMRKDIVDAMVEDLMGTCKDISSLDGNFEIKFDELTKEELRYFDEQIFLCPRCEWWYETGAWGTIYGEDVCGDCIRDDMTSDDDWEIIDYEED